MLYSGGQNQKWPASGPGGYITQPSVGSQMPQCGGHNRKWPTSGPGGYITPADRGIPHDSERGTKSKLAHKWAQWLHNPCRLGGSPMLESEGPKIRSGHGGGGGGGGALRVLRHQLPLPPPPPPHVGGLRQRCPTLHGHQSSRKSPRREVVRSSAGAGVGYPPIFGVICVTHPKA